MQILFLKMTQSVLKFLPPDSEMLRDMKWGFIFDADDTLVRIINEVNTKGLTIENMPGYSIGQGLNLKKSAIFSAAELKEYSVQSEAAYPFFVTEESGVYCWNRTEHFLVDKKNIDTTFVQLLKCNHELFAINGFSASCVDLYAPNGNNLTDDIIRLWLYMNTSLFWLIREIVGRTNLGGGMLKAEAVDIKPFAILFPINITEEIKTLFNSAREVVVANAQEEIYTEMHKRIDKIVYDFLELTTEEREYINRLLIEKIDARYDKTKAK